MAESQLVFVTWVLVGATIIGPVAAVQIERFLARRREARERQAGVFRTLMATRAAMLSRDHVAAINAVPIEFHTVPRVMEKWRAYFAHLDVKPIDQGWLNRRLDLYTDMLAAIAKRLDYPFEPLQIKNEIYSPEHYAKLEEDEAIVRKGMVAIMKGEKAFPLEVKSIAQDESAAKLQFAVNKALLDWLSGATTTSVHRSDHPPMPPPPPKRVGFG
jgi:hypothetical protein